MCLSPPVTEILDRKRKERRVIFRKLLTICDREHAVGCRVAGCIQRKLVRVPVDVVAVFLGVCVWRSKVQVMLDAKHESQVIVMQSATNRCIVN